MIGLFLSYMTCTASSSSLVCKLARMAPPPVLGRLASRSVPWPNGYIQLIVVVRNA